MSDQDLNKKCEELREEINICEEEIENLEEILLTEVRQHANDTLISHVSNSITESLDINRVKLHDLHCEYEKIMELIEKENK